MITFTSCNVFEFVRSYRLSELVGSSPGVTKRHEQNSRCSTKAYYTAGALVRRINTENAAWKKHSDLVVLPPVSQGTHDPDGHIQSIALHFAALFAI